VLLTGLHLSQNARGCLFLVICLHSENWLEGGSELRIGLSRWERFLSNLNGLEHAQIPDLGEHINCIYFTGHFLFVGLDAAHEVVGGRGQLSDQIINLLLKFLKQRLSDLVFILIHEQSRIYFLDVSTDPVLVFELEALDVVSYLALGVHNSEVFLLDEVKLEEGGLAEVSIETAYHVLILELSIRCVVVDNGKKRQFCRK